VVPGALVPTKTWAGADINPQTRPISVTPKLQVFDFIGERE
jgi:hypothetical protein